jgi:hypothetical protein
MNGADLGQFQIAAFRVLTTESSCSVVTKTQSTVCLCGLRAVVYVSNTATIYLHELLNDKFKCQVLDNL